jgi:hypothetical protein
MPSSGVMDKMVPLATIISRSEALVVVSMLEAAGIITSVGCLHHASAELNSTALGHYRLSVPSWQYEDASTILWDTSFTTAPYIFSAGPRIAVIRLLCAKFAAQFSVITLTMLTTGLGSPWMMAIPFGLLDTPVNPQGRSEYYLSGKSRVQ